MFKRLFKRKLVSQLTERLTEPRRFIQIVVGPRQTGKTTAVTQVLDELQRTTHFVSADDPSLNSTKWLRNEWEQARALAKSGEAILVVGSTNYGLEDFLLGKNPIFI